MSFTPSGVVMGREPEGTGPRQPGSLLSLLLAVLLVHSSAPARGVVGAERCQFPEEWRGRWYQGGLGEVVIKDSVISKKGICRAHDGDSFYVLEDRDNDCKRCMYMMIQHRNVIQYKEGFCVGDNKHTIKEVCEYMKTEAILYTLVREPSTPVRCPFQGAYFFSYNNNTGGECRSPASYIQPCASAAKYSFHFQACPAVPHAFEREMKFECLATWRTGSDTFIYGGFSGFSVLSRDQSYRCFKFKALGRHLYMSMSADPSCLGLDGPHTGPLTMELETDAINWPTAGCKFADFLDDVNWIDLSGKHYYLLSKKKSVITVAYKRAPNAKPHIKFAFRCVAIRKHNQTNNEYTYITHASHGCEPVRQCLRLRLKRPNVLEIIQGRRLEDEGEDCDDTKFVDPLEMHLALPETLRPQSCPGAGRYTLDGSENGCEGALRMGCNYSSAMHLHASCLPDKSLSLHCMAHWQEKGKIYIIARKARLKNQKPRSPVANCFTLQRVEDRLHLRTDDSCNLEVMDLLGRRAEPYLLKTPASRCNKRKNPYVIRNPPAPVPGTKQKPPPPPRKVPREDPDLSSSSSTGKVKDQDKLYNNIVNKNDVDAVEKPLESSSSTGCAATLRSGLFWVFLCACAHALCRTVLVAPCSGDGGGGGAWIL